MKTAVSARRYLEQQEPNNKRITWQAPIKGESMLSNHTIWWDTSMRYRVTLSVSKFGADTVFYAHRKKVVKQFDGKKHVMMVECGKDHYRHIEKALEACEEAHCRRFKLTEVESNREDVIVAAEKERLDRVTVVGREGGSPGRSQRPTESKGPGTGKARINMLGHPVTAVLRWMGKDAFDFAEARKVCDAFGVEVSDNTIRAQLAAGKKGERGPAAELSQQHIDKIYETLEEEE